MEAPDKIRSELKGTTLRVYWMLLKKGSEGAGPREVQRELEMSSPSVAAYHLEKLKGLGLASKNPSGSYMAVKEIDAEVLTDYVRVVGMMLPRYLFYSVLFTTMLVTYLIVYPVDSDPRTIVSVIFGLTGCIVTWVETIRAWLRRPF